ncbi:MAG: response regulator [Desulfobulbaceae bacterium]|nr:response regulator [Desulfobulbaceae bacterium]
MATILIVDDDPDVLKMLGDALQRAGHQIWRATDGEVGLREFRRLRPRLVITDLIMPNKEGLELIMALNAEQPRPKIIAMSGGGKLAPESYLPLAEKIGADAVLEKPFLPSALLALISGLLGGR